MIKMHRWTIAHDYVFGEDVVWDANGEFVKYEDFSRLVSYERWKAFWEGVVMTAICFLIAMFIGGCVPTQKSWRAGDPTTVTGGDYLQKSYLDKTKLLLKNKDGEVKGYYQRSLLDHSKLLFKKPDGTVVGAQKVDRLNSTKTIWVRP